MSESVSTFIVGCGENIVVFIFYNNKLLWFQFRILWWNRCSKTVESKTLTIISFVNVIYNFYHFGNYFGVYTCTPGYTACENILLITSVILNILGALANRQNEIRVTMQIGHTMESGTSMIVASASLNLTSTHHRPSTDDGAKLLVFCHWILLPVMSCCLG